MGPQRGDDGRGAAGGGRAPVPAGRLRRRLSGRARGPVLRAAVREQGARRGGRPQVGGARGARLREASDERPLADRVRHQPVRVPDAARPGRRGFAVQDSIEFIHDTLLPRVTIAPEREPVAVHPVCSVRKMGSVDKLAAIAGRCSDEVRRGRRGAVLRLRRRRGLQPPGAQRARPAPPARTSHSRRLHQRLLERAAPARSACPSRRASRTGRSFTSSSAARRRGPAGGRLLPPVPAGRGVRMASATSSAMSRD